jgi:hypothetical protein
VANLDDLGFSSITDKSTDEALETIRRIRQARLTKQTPQKSAKAIKTSSKKPKELNLSSEQAEALLRKLTGE